MKKGKALLLLTVGISLSISLISYAGTWQQDQNGWKYRNENGDYAKGWILDNNNYYYLGNDGYMLSNTTSPDGYTLLGDGAWNENIEKKPEETSASNETSATAETQPSTEAQTETVKETQKETVKETEAPTKAVETVPETTKAVETTAAPKTNTGNWSVSADTIDSVITKGESLANEAKSQGINVHGRSTLIGVSESKGVYGENDIVLSKNGNEYNLDLYVRLNNNITQTACRELLRLTGSNSNELYDAIHQSFESDGSAINYDTFVDVAGHQVKAVKNGNSITYIIK